MNDGGFRSVRIAEAFTLTVCQRRVQIHQCVGSLQDELQQQREGS